MCTLNVEVQITEAELLDILLSMDDDRLTDIIIKCLDRKSQVAKKIGDHIIAWPEVMK